MRKQRLLTRTLSVLALLALLFTTGCATTTPTPPTQKVTPSAAGHTTPVEQDPAIRITTQEVMALFAKEYGDAPLIEETLKKNQSFILVDTRPAARFNLDTVPGSIHIPKPFFERDIPKLPKDKTIIFFCGGLACPFTPEAAAVAQKHGYTNIKAWYEGEPGWSKAGNYTIISTPEVKKLVDAADKGGFALIDARPHPVYQKEFIPGATSIPLALWEQKKGLLPADKETLLIFYCGGHHCELSHLSALKAIQMGYTKVRVYAEGIPAWKKAGHGTWGNESSGIVEAPKGPAETISEADLRQGIADNSIFIVDVRSEREFKAGHMPGATNIPDGEFYNDIEGVIAKLPTAKKVVVVCATGARSSGAFFALDDEIADGKYKNEKGVLYLPKNVLYKDDGTFEIN